jgi:hypothetical protein
MAIDRALPASLRDLAVTGISAKAGGEVEIGLLAVSSYGLATVGLTLGLKKTEQHSSSAPDADVDYLQAKVGTYTAVPGPDGGDPTTLAYDRKANIAYIGSFSGQIVSASVQGTGALMHLITAPNQIYAVTGLVVDANSQVFVAAREPISGGGGRNHTQRHLYHVLPPASPSPIVPPSPSPSPSISPYPTANVTATPSSGPAPGGPGGKDLFSRHPWVEYVLVIIGSLVLGAIVWGANIALARSRGTVDDPSIAQPAPQRGGDLRNTPLLAEQGPRV